MTKSEIHTLHHRRSAATRSARLPHYLTQPRDCGPGSSSTGMMVMITRIRSAGRRSVTGTLITTPQQLLGEIMLSEASDCEADRVAVFCFSAGFKFDF